RFTGSPGFEEAAQYVAERFKEIGLEPLGDNGTYFQRFPVQIVDLAGTPTLSRTGANAKTWTHRVDFTESIGGRAGNGTADAKLAVVGGGAATGGQDDFAGVDVKGRIALVTGPTATGYQENIVQRGGLGILVVGEPTIKYSYIAQQFAQTIPMLVVSETTANELLAPSGKTVMQVRDAVRARRSNTSTLDVGFGVDTNLQMSVPVTPVRQVMATNVSRALQDRFRAAASRAAVPFNGVGGGGSDQQPFSRRGVPAILVLWSDYILHTTKDTVDKVDLRHLQRAGDVVSAVALDLA